MMFRQSIILSLTLFPHFILSTKNKRDWPTCYENFSKTGKLYKYQKNSKNWQTWACIPGLGRFLTDSSKRQYDLFDIYYPEKDALKYQELYYFKFKSEAAKRELCSFKNSEISREFFRFTEAVQLKEKQVKLADYYRKYFDIIPVKIKVDQKIRNESFFVENFDELKNSVNDNNNNFDFYDPVNRKTVILTHGFSPSPEVLGQMVPTNKRNIDRLRKRYISGETFGNDTNAKFAFKWTVSKPASYINCFDKDQAYNVFIHLWIPISIMPYDRSAANTRAVGRFIANFLTESYSHEKHSGHKFDFNSVTLVGFSLGAHSMGIAGKQISYRTKTSVINSKKYATRDRFGNQVFDPQIIKKPIKVNRIFGLDPASYLYFYDVTKDQKNGLSNSYLNNYRLQKTDANQVIAIHTDTFSTFSGVGAGSFKLAGHIDIFPNNGTNQLRCHNIYSDFKNLDSMAQKTFKILSKMALAPDNVQQRTDVSKCDHLTSSDLFSEAIKREILGYDLLTTYQTHQDKNEFLSDFESNRENKDNQFEQLIKAKDNNFCQKKMCYPITLNRPNNYPKNHTGTYFLLLQAPQRDNLHILPHFLYNLKRQEFCLQHLILEMTLMTRHRTKEEYAMSYSMDITFRLEEIPAEIAEMGIIRNYQQISKSVSYTVENTEQYLAGANTLKFVKNPNNQTGKSSKMRIYHDYRITTGIPCCWMDAFKQVKLKSSSSNMSTSSIDYFLKNFKIDIFFTQTNTKANNRPLAIKLLKVSFFDKLSHIGENGHDVVPGDKIYMAKKSPQGRLIHQMRLFKNSKTESYSFDFLKKIE